MKKRHYVMLPFCAFGIIINGINLFNHIITPLIIVGFGACCAGLVAGFCLVAKEHNERHSQTEVSS